MQLLVLIRIIPAALMVGYGVYYLSEVFFPSVREREYDHQDQVKIQDDLPIIWIMGFPVDLRQKRIVSTQLLSPQQARKKALIQGLLLTVVGLAMVLWQSGIWKMIVEHFSSAHSVDF